MTSVLEGKVFIVTGAGSGIGAGIALTIARQGGRVLLLGRTPATLERTATAIASTPGASVVQRCDASREADVEAAVARALEEWGRIDGLVNNAGVARDAHFLEWTREEWDQLVEINLTAAFLMAQAAGREMARRGSGSIVNISSVTAHLGEETCAPYNTTKAALLGLTRSLALDLGPLGIRSNTVSPGYVNGTPMADVVVDGDGDGGDGLAAVLQDWKRVPSRRMVTIEEVANACLFLLSDAASGLNGSELVVDGGLTSNLYALESVPATGFAAAQDEARARVNALLGSLPE